MNPIDDKKQANRNGVSGYTGKILRINLTEGTSEVEAPDESFLKDYIGGTSMGIKYIYDEVDPKANWDDSDNLLFIGTGPLGGTKVAGTGGVSVVTKGALTNGMSSSQAQGFFGAYLRKEGYDALILQGGTHP